MNCPSLHPFLFFSLALHRSRLQLASAVVTACISRGRNLHQHTTLSCNLAAHPWYGTSNHDTWGGSLEYLRACNLVYCNHLCHLDLLYRLLGALLGWLWGQNDRIYRSNHFCKFPSDFFILDSINSLTLLTKLKNCF